MREKGGTENFRNEAVSYNFKVTFHFPMFQACVELCIIFFFQFLIIMYGDLLTYYNFTTFPSFGNKKGMENNFLWHTYTHAVKVLYELCYSLPSA